jgi:hypothetical protein
MRKKTFDTVEMKTQAQEALLQQLEGMTPEEELEFWKQRTAEMRIWQATLRSQRRTADEERADSVGAANRKS